MHHGGEHFFARQAAQGHVLGELGADRRQRAGELHHVLVFRALANLAELWVIAVLLTAFGVASGRLNMTIGLGADPHVGIGRWDGEFANALEGRRVAHGFAVRLQVSEALAGPLAPDAALLIRDVDQTGRFGGVAGIDDGLDFGVWLKRHGTLRYAARCLSTGARLSRFPDGAWSILGLRPLPRRAAGCVISGPGSFRSTR